MRRSKPLPRSRTPIARRKRIKHGNAYTHREYRKLVRQVHQRSGNVCEYCHDAPRVGDPHHEEYVEGMVGPKRLLVPIEKMKDACRACHLEREGNPEGLFA